MKSDFRDFYDHWFEIRGHHPVFERMATGGLDRPGLFRFLESLDMRVPRYGLVRDLVPLLREEREALLDARPATVYKDRVVVYLDTRTHRGEGKKLMAGADALHLYPDHYASEFIPGPRGVPVSWRYLQVGDRPFWLEYRSDDEWRSNCGNVEIRVMAAVNQSRIHPRIPHPLYAIDFVWSGLKAYAVDFNIAPGIRGSGVEKILTAEEAARAIIRVLLRSQPQEVSNDARLDLTQAVAHGA